MSISPIEEVDNRLESDSTFTLQNNVEKLDKLID